MLNKIEGTCVLALARPGQRNSIINIIPNNRMFHTRVKAASRIGPHNQDVISVIIGWLRGDCYTNKRSIEGTRLWYKLCLYCTIQTLKPWRYFNNIYIKGSSVSNPRKWVLPYLHSLA